MMYCKTKEKKGFLMTLVVICFLLITFYGYVKINNIYYQSLIQAPSTMSKTFSQKPIILWDIHDVLFEKNIFHWAFLIITAPNKWSMLAHLNTKSITLLIAYVLRKIKLSSQEVTSQELINAARESSNTSLIDLIINVGCSYEPNYQAIAIAQELHLQGFIQHIGSNIGTQVFAIFQQTHQPIFALFQDYTIANPNDKGIVYKKPNTEFFIHYLKKHHLQPQDVIFIDDRPANVYAAQQIGIRALHFSSAEQLEKDLKIIGII